MLEQYLALLIILMCRVVDNYPVWQNPPNFNINCYKNLYTITYCTLFSIIFLQSIVSLGYLSLLKAIRLANVWLWVLMHIGIIRNSIRISYERQVWICSAFIAFCGMQLHSCYSFYSYNVSVFRLLVIIQTI